MVESSADKVSRRRVLSWIAAGAGVVAAAAIGGFELVEHGVLPGKYQLDQLDGACSVAAPPLTFAPVGESISGAFFSKARRRSVGFTIGFPPGTKRGDELPLIVMLHGDGRNHFNALEGMTPAQAVALKVDGASLKPTALVTVDGGNEYWNPHPHDDPMAMVVDELIPLCQKQGLGRSPTGLAMMGISMGGYGALAIAERNHGLVSAVAAISPAIWTTYEQAKSANAGAFSSAADFAAGDVITHVGALAGTPLRVASSYDDPFLPGVQSFAQLLKRDDTVVFSAGCHSAPFFLQQEPPSLAFLCGRLS
ncbi:MAG TPA: alpha/beta hydrolase-fold protein [Acidimicrobiales bacterium]|jgi:enterochelin esterase-like enzyme|nr:alpha/beta hydrolase-fold protein [Acidimicrobiales bacterium]